MSNESFEEMAFRERRRSFLLELWHFLLETKKWWLFPVLTALLLLGMLMWMSSSAAAPFIYTLF
jgi:Family of unknown function (DUF5989)